MTTDEQGSGDSTYVHQLRAAVWTCVEGTGTGVTQIIGHETMNPDMV